MSIRKLVLIVGLVCIVCVSSQAAGKPAPGFARKPVVREDAKGHRIEFEVKDTCDVTVAIVDAKGKVVRHLVSGVLGANPPAPLRKNSLKQSLIWDGKDDFGKPAPTDCKVKVGLGLKASFERFIRAAPQGVASRGPVGIACDEQGTLYVAEGSLHVARVTTLVNLKAFDREGNYLRTVIPFRADWPAGQISAIEFLQTPDGRRLPLSGAHGHRPFSGFLSGMPGMRRHTPLVSSDGRYIFVSGRPVADEKGSLQRRLLCVGADGTASRELFTGPPLPVGSWYTDTFLALSPDEKHIYVAGTAARGGKYHHGVYRLQWGDREPPRPLLGVEFEAGSDEHHFNQPRGLATDSEGRIYVCDYMNDRVQVFSATGEYLKTLPLTGPEQILVHPKSDEIYVLSVRDRGKTSRYAEVVWELYEDKSIIKFKSLDDFKELARIDLPRRARHFHDCPPILYLDATQETPVIWAANVGRQEPTDFLWKIVDEGDSLVRVEHRVRRYDRRQSVLRPIIAAARNTDEFYMTGGGTQGIARYDAETGRATSVTVPGIENMQVGDAAVGPDGMLYLSYGKTIGSLDQRPRYMRWLIRRYTRQGKPVPFGDKEAIETLGHHLGTWAGEKCGPFAVAPDGKVYVVEFASPTGPRCRLNLYSADGRLLKEGFIADMTKTAGDVAVGGRGGLYVADAVKPIFPGVTGNREFPSFLGSDPRLHFKLWYGTVCRFPTTGGSFHHVAEGENLVPTHRGYHNAPVVVQGALWQYYGISPMTQGANCECVVARMDADGWGRLFLPDVPGYSIQVIDAQGNFITRFGGYGNYDAQGPGSAVPVPEIPLWFPDSVAALDGHAAIVDSHNRRVVQVKLSYVAEETTGLK